MTLATHIVMSNAYFISSYSSGPRSDQVSRFKLTKRERAKIDKGLTNGKNSPWVGKALSSILDAQRSRETDQREAYYKPDYFWGILLTPALNFSYSFVHNGPHQVSSIAQKAAVTALGKENAGGEAISHMVKAFCERRDILLTALRELVGVRIYEPQVVRAVGNDGTRLDIPEGPLGNLIAYCWAEPDQRPNYSRNIECLDEGRSGGKNVGRFSGGRDGGRSGNGFSVDSPGGYPYTVRPFGIRRNAKIAYYITVRGDKVMQLLENGLKVKEYKLLRCNFTDTDCFGFGIQEHIDLGIKYDPSTVSMGAMGGKQGRTYVVSDSTHGDHVTVAFNNFKKGLFERMSRCRHGYFHVVNNDYIECQLCAIDVNIHLLKNVETEEAGIFCELHVLGDGNADVIDHLDERSSIVMVEPYMTTTATATTTTLAVTAAAGTEEEQAKNFQWGLRRSTLNHLMCMSYTDVANATRNYEILHERDDDDAERPDKRKKSGDRHQPTSQQSSHRNYGHNNDRHGSDRRGGGDNHRSNNYSGNNNRNSGNGRDQRNRGHQSNRSANSGVPLRATPTQFALLVDADTQESVVELLVLASSVVKLAICIGLQEEHHCEYIWSG
nr:60S ribosomal protein L11 [Tanacetum cinerariifolium]